MRIVGLVLTLAAGLLVTSPASAADATTAACDGCGTPTCCAKCGCHAACRPVTCEVVAGTTKVKKYCWGVECVDFAPLMPGRLPDLPGALCDLLKKPCEGECGDCGECGGCGHCDKAPSVVPPKCAHVRTKKILVRKEYEIEVPVYKCVVKQLCGECAPAVDGPQPGPAPVPAAPLPPPPAPIPGQQAYDFAPFPATF